MPHPIVMMFCCVLCDILTVSQFIDWLWFFRSCNLDGWVILAKRRRVEVSQRIAPQLPMHHQILHWIKWHPQKKNQKDLIEPKKKKRKKHSVILIRFPKNRFKFDCLELFFTYSYNLPMMCIFVDSHVNDIFYLISECYGYQFHVFYAIFYFVMPNQREK